MVSMHKQSLPEEDECTQASTDSVLAKLIGKFTETPQIRRTNGRNPETQQIGRTNRPSRPSSAADLGGGGVDGMIPAHLTLHNRPYFVPTSKILILLSKSGKTCRRLARRLVGRQVCRLGRRVANGDQLCLNDQSCLNVIPLPL